ncbi:MAG TPA: hypothetical protein VFH82_07405 [Gemmatimonadota bacterium]|nr:hypothetical protein [Gemmatimonadota bacterium]
MKYLGLLMINAEDDILADTLRVNAKLVDAFYVLDGTQPNDTSRAICRSFDNCHDYLTEADMSDGWGERPRDGWRETIYQMAAADHGYDNWFLLLHGDEVWTFDPRAVTARWPNADGFGFRLPFYFPIEADGWDDSRPALEQLRWRLGPGWPEFRMFRGSQHVHYDRRQHFDTQPHGLTNVAWTDLEIRHYPFRSPETQRARARRHEETGFDPDNYRHILDGDAVYWTDEMIEAFRRREQFRELACV